MKWIFYSAVLAVSLLAPVKRTDVALLQPVEVISLYMEGAQTVLETDTGDLGKGTSVEQALEDLKQTTPGIVYLDTAEYLLVAEGTESRIPEIAAYLKNDVKLCTADPGIDLTLAALYLDVHSPEMTVSEWREGKNPEKLVKENDRLQLDKKETEKS